MDFLENINDEEKKGLLLLYFGRGLGGGSPVEYCSSIAPRLSDIYDLMLDEGYLKIIGTRLSGDLNIDNVILTEKGKNVYSSLENKWLYLNDFLNKL
jgi:hypothetical protein